MNIVIPAIVIQTDTGPCNAPASPFPPEATEILFDGEKYVVTVPDSQPEA